MLKVGIADEASEDIISGELEVEDDELIMIMFSSARLTLLILNAGLALACHPHYLLR